MGISSCFLTPLKTLALPAQLQLWPQATSFSHYIAYLFVTISFIVSLTTNSTEGERNTWPSYLFQYDRWKSMGEEREQEGEIFSFAHYCRSFKAHPAFSFFFGGGVWFCVLIQPINIYTIFNVLGKNEIIYVWKNLYGSSKFNFSKKNVLFSHRFRLLIKTFDTFLLVSFFFWKFFLFLPERWWKLILKSHNILFIPKKYISVMSLIYSFLGTNRLIISELGYW